jgi:hypothetical protein
MTTHPLEKPVLPAKEKINEQTPNLNLIERVLSLIGKAQLDSSGMSADEFKKQERELSRRKKISHEMIDEVLSCARNYSGTVLQMVNFISSSNRYRMEDWEYKEKMTDLDQRRRASHDTLIDSIAIATRYVRLNFGKLSDGELEKFEDDSKRRKKLVLAVERVVFSDKIIFPESMDFDDRNQVADWAEKLVKERMLRDLE